MRSGGIWTHARGADVGARDDKGGGRATGQGAQWTNPTCCETCSCCRQKLIVVLVGVPSQLMTRMAKVDSTIALDGIIIGYLF